MNLSSVFWNQLHFLNLCSWDQVRQVRMTLLTPSCPSPRTTETGGRFQKHVFFAHLLQFLMCFSAESKSAALTQNPSNIKIAPNHTAGKSFSTDALDRITVALSIAENIFLTSLSKKHNNKQSVGHPLPRCRHSEKILEANSHICLTDAIIHVHKLAAGKFLWNSHHALVKLRRTISRL